MNRISVCIATHERPERLRGTIAALERQTLRPHEVVISDSSRVEDPALLRALAASPLGIKRVRSEKRALPWQRWWAFCHATGDILFFLDDDIVLREDGVATLARAWERLEKESREPTAGVGLIVVDALGNRAPRRHGSPRERWLGLSGLADGRVSPGGLTVSLGGSAEAGLVGADWLSGGAMSYRRSVLESVGVLDCLVALYEEGYGKGEDAVFAAQARRLGSLWVITEPIARHCDEPGTKARAVPQAGWRRGMWGTWGRAHTMRWIATDRRALLGTWLRMASLEVARSMAALLRAPLSGAAWARLAGSVWGSLRSVVRWNRIPSGPRSAEAVSPLPAGSPALPRTG